MEVLTCTVIAAAIVVGILSMIVNAYLTLRCWYHSDRSLRAELKANRDRELRAVRIRERNRGY